MVSDNIINCVSASDALVLILVLMEDGLWQVFAMTIWNKKRKVLILVLMEDGLWQLKEALAEEGLDSQS